MAALKAKASKTAISTGTSLKTVLQIKAPANQRVSLTELGIGFHGTTNTNEPITVELFFQSTAGTMTAIAAGFTGGAGLAALDQDAVETIQTTAQHTATVEPTPGNSAAGPYTIHPQTAIVIPFAKGDVTLKGGGYLGVCVTAPNSVNCDVYVKFEE